MYGHRLIRSMSGPVWIAFALAWGLRAGFVAYNGTLGWQLPVDAGLYLTLAQHIEHGVYSLFHPLDIPDTTRMPGYPLLLHWLGGDILLVLLLQALLSALKVPLVHVLALRVGLGARMALLPAFLLAVDPVDIILAGNVLTEAVFGTLLLAALVLVTASATWRNVLGAALFFGAAAWVRPNGLHLLLVAAVLVAVLRWWPWERAAVMAVVGCLLLVPWALRNQREVGRFVLSDSGPVAAAYFHLPQVYATAGDPRAHTYRRELDARAAATDWEDPQAAGAFFNTLRGDLWQAMRTRPLAWAWVHLRGTVGIHLSPGRGHIRGFFGSGAVAGALIALSAAISLLLLLAVPLWLVRIRRMPPGLVVVLVVAAALLLSGGISTTDARFKNPAMPLLLVGVAWAMENTRHKRVKAPPPTTPSPLA